MGLELAYSGLTAISVVLSIKNLAGRKNMAIFIQGTGWIGTILIVLAYFLVSRQYVTGKSKIYQLMNLFGAIGVGIN